MDFSEEQVVELYEKKELSVREIARELGTYENKILRILKKLGTKMRTKSEAQKLALKSNRHKHPTKGKKRSSEVKEKISESVHSMWESMSSKEKKRRSDIGKKQWDEMSEEERANLQTLASEAVRVAAKEGSKIEKFLYKELSNRGENVIFHKKGLIPNENLEIDLFLPEYGLAIEIDGPSHFYPIWGEENLQRHIKADAEKAGLLMSYKYNILRIKYMSKNVSGKHKRDILACIDDTIKKVKNKKLKLNERYFELEIK